MWIVAMLGCSEPAVQVEPPAPVPAPVVAPEVLGADALSKVLAGELELGSCRKGAVRVEGKIVAKASDPEHAAWFRTLLTDESLPVAAIAAGVLFDVRAVPAGEDLASLGTVLTRLQAAEPAEVASMGCRRLKGLDLQARLWTARGDALALLARTEDKAGALAALEASGDPVLLEVGKAALGDAKAHARVTEKCFRQLCATRTWETSWMLRALDSGVDKGSLVPLGMMSTGGCDYLAETGKMPTEGATSKARPR